MKNTKSFIPTGSYMTNRTLAILLAALMLVAVISLSSCSKGVETVLPTQADLPTRLEKKEELAIPMPAKPPSLNPLEAKSKEMVFLFSLIFESPLRCDEKGQAEPGLAENWSCDEQGKEWTFNIRKGIKFQNGDDLKAEDIVYTLDQMKGYKAGESTYADYAKIISDYSAKDEYTLLVKTSEPGSALPYAMMFPVLDKKYYGSNAKKTNKTPMGTGPYSVESYESETGMNLIANENWWKKQPQIKRITAKCRPGNEEALASYDIGEFDMVYTPEITASKYREAGRTQITEVPTMNYECLIPNTTSGDLSDARMRQAILYALDRQEIIRRAYLSHAVITDVPIPPQSYLYDGRYKVYEYEPVKAVSLLESLGWKNQDDDGFLEDSSGSKLTLKLLFNDDIDNPARKEVARTIVEQLGKIGIKVELDGQAWTKYVGKLNSKQFDLALGGYNIRMDMNLSSMLRSGGTVNLSKHTSDELDNALLQCADAVDIDKQKTAFSNLQKLFVDELPNIPLCFRSNLLVHTEKLSLEGATDMDIFKRIERWVLYQ